MTTWNHPELGVFRNDGDGWARTFTLPAFKVFRYRLKGRQVGRSKVGVRIKTDSDDEHPSRRAITIAKRIIKNHEKLVPKLKRALFDDINGIGPNSGMWWRGDAGSISDALSAISPGGKRREFADSDDLDLLLRTREIVIDDGSKKPFATVGFYAVFDPGHGVGIVTDGNRVLGIGYEYDALPFK
ncbi:hypothetical protein SH528x_004961 [Novipirellula sp. SH528]|uniref:hypothetical protein n=1 Tax=Novipirellula sp. SH528 TaxID=3454466 RepID=UPI003F9FED8D